MRGSKIIKSGDNAYTFRVDFPSADGNRKQKRITVKGSYKDAERRQREILSQIDQRCFSVSPAKMTLGEFLDYYLEIVKGKRESTYKGYVKSFKVFRKLLGNQLLLSEIKTDVVQRAVNELSSKLKNSSVERYFVNFKTSFKYASSPVSGTRFSIHVTA